MKIAIGGSAANPPHFGHKQLVETVLASGMFDQVYWIISGNRPDKPGMISSHIRYQMSQMLFANNDDVLISYETVDAIPTFQVIANLQMRFPKAEIVWYCGADHFVPRKQFGGKCDILGFWDDGDNLFVNQRFLIVPRRGIDMDKLQLPKKYQILNMQMLGISSTMLREQIVNGGSVIETSPEIIRYIAENGLYQLS